jgi:hypothetical protein
MQPLPGVPCQNGHATILESLSGAKMAPDQLRSPKAIKILFVPFELNVAERCSKGQASPFPSADGPLTCFWHLLNRQAKPLAKSELIAKVWPTSPSRRAVCASICQSCANEDSGAASTADAYLWLGRHKRFIILDNLAILLEAAKLMRMSMRNMW